MKLLLQLDIPKLGYLGDVVEVADGYGRNYLLPQGLAIEPTERNIKAIEGERARKAEERRLVRQGLEKAAAKVDGASIRIAARANEQGHLFGSVGEKEIALTLREQGYEVRTAYVAIPEHFRMLGSYEVKLDFGHEIAAQVNLEVVRPEDEASVEFESGSESESEAGASGAESAE